MTIYHCYKITNLINSKIYIGQTTCKNPKSRWALHTYDARKRLKNTVLCRAMRKHGIENFTFEVIACCNNLEDLNQTEILLIEQYDSHISRNGYNMEYGGQNKTGFMVSKETRLKLSKSLKNRPKSDSHRKNISMGRIGCRGALKDKYGHEHPLSKKYKISFENGQSTCIQGLQNWCKQNGYDHSSIYKLFKNKLKRVRDIIKIEII